MELAGRGTVVGIEHDQPLLQPPHEQGSVGPVPGQR